ncbi:MAG: hypothetical protein QF805_23140, partial [Pirellulaceae bacterium]|nr:hypothetical protein [Pirellulaceae bacterium]
TSGSLAPATSGICIAPVDAAVRKQRRLVWMVGLNIITRLPGDGSAVAQHGAAALSQALG